MPRHRKPADWRQRTNTRDLGEVFPPDEADPPPIDAIEVPKPPFGLLRATRVSWERYFRSVARHVTVLSLDLDLLERLWTLYDERTRAQRELRKPQRDAEGKIRRSDSRVVEGSTGQMRASPFYMVISRLDAEIRQLEDRVAKHMKSRLNLGMVVGDSDRPDEPDQPRVTAADDVDDDLPGQDPRLYVMDGGAR